jgi:hypothetical protein
VIDAPAPANAQNEAVAGEDDRRARGARSDDARGGDRTTR